MDPNTLDVQQSSKPVVPVYGGAPQAGMPYALETAPTGPAAQPLNKNPEPFVIPHDEEQQPESPAVFETPPPPMPEPVALPEPAPLPEPIPQLPPTPQAPVAAQPMVSQTPMQPMPQPAAQNPGVKPAGSNPNSTQNTLQIAEIRDGVVIMSDGSFRSVIMVKSINFDLMSQSEQEAIEYNYQNFLNSLYFPIQIFVRSAKVDLTPYLDKLDKIRSEHDNMLLALLMEDYIGYISALAQQTNIMDKKFYIVIPYFPHVEVQKALTQSKNFISGVVDLFNGKEQHVVINEADLEKAKTELRNRVQSVLAGLQQANLQALPLDTQELIELYYDTYNPDTATRQQLKNFDDVSVDIVTKGQGAAPNPQLDRELQ